MRASSFSNGSRGRIDRDVADDQARQRVLVARLHAAQHGVDARGQLARVERLGQVVVGADLEADDAIDVLAAGGEQDDGNGGTLSQGTQNLEAVLLGQHHIQNHQPVAAARRQIDGARARVVGFDVEPLGAQQLADQVAQLPIVVDDEDRPGRHRSDCLRKGAPVRVKKGKESVKDS